MAGKQYPVIAAVGVDTASDSRSTSPVAQKAKTPWWTYLWVRIFIGMGRAVADRRKHQDHDPTRSSEEAKFIRKLDVFLVSILCLGYFIKNLDQANVSVLSCPNHGASLPPQLIPWG